MFRSVVTALVILVGTLLWYPANTRADDASEFQRLITGQIAAFNADDGARAFSYATPMLQQMFGTPDNFLNLVKRSYPPVYRQKSYEFAGLSADNAGRPSQKVIIIDGKGKVWTAFYFFEQQPNGSWRIGGCVLVDPEGADA